MAPELRRKEAQLLYMSNSAASLISSACLRGRAGRPDEREVSGSGRPAEQELAAVGRAGGRATKRVERGSQGFRV